MVILGACTEEIPFYICREKNLKENKNKLVYGPFERHTFIHTSQTPKQKLSHKIHM